uniref:(California timema) hypothetical protein n=1 Tax=Timema californicum TaxID=61474 RepID=A0A7R9J530_TIMCA|nr:unnamed protein product [Timema californicum]
MILGQTYPTKSPKRPHEGLPATLFIGSVALHNATTDTHRDWNLFAEHGPKSTNAFLGANPWRRPDSINRDLSVPGGGKDSLVLVYTRRAQAQSASRPPYIGPVPYAFHPTEIRTSISPSSAVDLNMTSACHADRNQLKGVTTSGLRLLGQRVTWDQVTAQCCHIVVMTDTSPDVRWLVHPDSLGLFLKLCQDVASWEDAVTSGCRRVGDPMAR